MVCLTVLMKRDWQEWFANLRDGMGMVYIYLILQEWDGNGTVGMGRNGTGFDFHSHVPLYPRHVEYICQVSSTSAQQSRNLRVLKIMTAHGGTFD